MYRPFLFFITFFMLGIILSAYASSEIYMIIGFSVVVFCLIYMIYKPTKFGKRKKTKKILLATLFILSGFMYFRLWSTKAFGDIQKYCGNFPVELIGFIEDAPIIKKDKVYYDINSLYIKKNNALIKTSGKVRVTVPKKDNTKLSSYGKLVVVEGVLRKPPGKRNPGGMDYRAYLAQKGITVIAFSREIKEVSDYKVSFLKKIALSTRGKIINFYEKYLPETEASLISGIVLGIKDSISKKTMENFSDMGILHLLAVSGLHVGIIYKFIEESCYYLGIPDNYSVVIKVLFLIFYSLMAGLTASVMRATVMITMAVIAKICSRKNDILNTLSFAGTIVLLRNPRSLFTISFQLSFGAVLGLILFYDFFKIPFDKLPRYLQSPIAAAISAQIFVLPFTIYYFNKISLAGIVFAPLIAPLASLALILGFMSGFVSLMIKSLAVVFVIPAGKIIVLIAKIAKVASKIPLLTIVYPSIPPYMVLLYFIGMFLFIIPIHLKKIDSKSLKRVITITLILIFSLAPLSKRNYVEVTFIDVGQGDSIFIRTDNGKTILIDGGGTPYYYEGEFNTGNDIIKPFLHSRGVKKLDLIVFSHFDQDHALGLINLLENFKVDTVIYGQPENNKLFHDMIKIVQKKNITVYSVSQGDEFYFGSVKFNVLHPKIDKYYPSSNDASVVLKMVYNDVSFLFTGDLEYFGERELIDSQYKVKSDILKIGHHGSKSSTSEEFLDQVSPSFAIISVGESNSFGHPSPDVLKFLEKRGINILRTDFSGAISFKIKGNNVKIHTTIPEEL